MLVKELGAKDMIKSSIIMLTVAFSSAALLNWILTLYGLP
jgi:hypothetical protein